MRFWALLFAIFLGLNFLGCQRPPTENLSRESGSPARTSAAAPTPVDRAMNGIVSGTVYFSGNPPKAAPINMSADPSCKGENESESLVVNDGKLQNVFVYLEGGFTFSPPTQPVIVEQQGCRYVPHVVAVAVTQPVEFRNLDGTNHNIFGFPHQNDSWNVSQPSQAPPLTRSFRHAETMIPVRCNQHPWMKMYVNVSDSPFFAVTDREGHFELKGVPPGTYDVVFVHEMLGTQRHTITVGVKEKKLVDISFAH
jgi:plastocyanin